MVYLLLTVAYVASGKLGLMLALPPGYASPIFPPAGIAVAAVLIGGRKTLPWIFLGSLLLNIWVGYSSHRHINSIGLTTASIIAMASTLQAALGGWWLRRMIGYPTALDHGGDILRFLLLAPVICLVSASLSVSGLSVLGVLTMTNFTANWAAWWVGDTLGVVVMLPLVMTVAGEPRGLWQNRARTVAIPILLIFTLFVVIFLKVNKWEHDDSLSEFRQLSQQVVGELRTRLQVQESLLEQTAGLFIHDTSGRVTREEFHRFVEKMLTRFPEILALEWAPRVDAERRANFEAAQRADFPNFEIRERNTAGELQRAGERTSFYPVTYVEPLAGNEPALGFNLASIPDRQMTLTEAAKGGTVVTTPPVQLAQGPVRMLLVLSVKLDGKESGFVLTALRLDDFMDRLLSTQSMLYTRLIDLDEQKTIYDSFIPGDQKALYARTFNFGTRHYRLETAPTPTYLMQHHGWQSWSVLAAGILGAGLLGALLLLGTGYTARIEAQVKDRTNELARSKERLSRVTHGSNDIFWEWDAKIDRVWWSPRFYEILGYAEGEFVTTYANFPTLLHPDDIEPVYKLINDHLANDTPYEIEYRLRVASGTYRWFYAKGKVTRDTMGKPVLFSGSAQDITERKQAEERLKLYAKELARSNDALRDFAAIASHDLQEPLRKIITFGDRLRSICTFGDQAEDYLGRMEKATHRMQNFIQDLLEYSRISNKSRQLQTVNLNNVASEVISDLESRITQTQASVEVGDLPSIEADSRQMHQFFQNMIGNALKFHRPGVPPRVLVNSRVAGPGQWEITIQDNGIGFDMKHLDRIMQPFQRLHGHSKYEGSGIGLAICQKVVENHGGKITADSTLEKGTCFTVLFPEKQ